MEEFGNIDDEFIKEALDMKKKVNFKPIIAVAACAAIALAAIPVAKLFANVTVGNTSVTTPAPVVPEDDFRVLYAGTSVMDGEYIEVDYPVETEFDGLSENFMDESKRGTKKTVEIDGVKYTGVYQNSTKSDYYRDDTDNYFVQIGEKKVTFTINRETGACRSLIISGKRASGEEITRNEAYAKAIAYLKAYVPDIENYELVNENSNGSVYDFIWQRKINGIKTTDAASVTMAKTGEIFTHVLQSTGSFENENAVAIDKQKIEKALSDKIDSMYPKYNGITYNAENIMLIRFANGKYAFEYRVNIEMRNEANEIKKDYAQFIIEMN